jgi:adenosyl cobinamide kinase/adenosyl cobinamide phosphate guanylyltransferase
MTDKRTLRERLEEVEITDGHAGVVIACVSEWLTGILLDKQKTYEYLQEKAKHDIIHRSMYFMSGAETDVLKELIAELASNNQKPIKGSE